MSDTLDTMLRARRGYRTESYSGSGVRDLRAVLKHEISVLGNSDVLIYCNEHYSAGFNLIPGTPVAKIPAKHVDSYVDQIEQLVRRLIRTKQPLYAIWLTTKNNVRRFYSGIDGEISCYRIPEVLVLSDLGREGVLFVYQRHPSVYLQGHPKKEKVVVVHTCVLRRCVVLILGKLRELALH